jgi:putative sterol carrier protein
MAGRQPIPWSETARHFDDIPLLAELARPFSDLLGAKGPIENSFKQLAAALARSKRTGVIQFTIEGETVRRWCVAISPTGCEATETATERPDLEIITDASSWSDIASGRVAPLEAFGTGKVRVRGNLELARLLARRARE